MPDTQSLHLALGAMTRKEREEFLGAALSQQPVEFLDSIFQKLALEDMPVNAKVRLVFKMGLSPVAHAFKAGPERQLQWVVPVVPEHLRVLVYATSRLINEFQETLACLQNGRGDFAKAFTLLNPENMLEMVNRFGDEMQTYTQQLRDANGRFNRTGQQRGRRSNGPRPAPTDKPSREQPAPEPTVSETESTQKMRKTSSRTRTKALPQTPDEAPGNNPAADSPPLESTPDVGASAEPAAVESNASASSTLSQEELNSFGFDVSAAAQSYQTESEK